MKTDLPETPGALPTLPGGAPDPARTLADAGAGNEAYTLATPGTKFPEGSYVLRVEGYRKNETQHYAHHQEKIFVNR